MRLIREDAWEAVSAVHLNTRWLLSGLSPCLLTEFSRQSSQILGLDSCMEGAPGLSTGMMLQRDAQSLDDEET